MPSFSSRIGLQATQSHAGLRGERTGHFRHLGEAEPGQGLGNLPHDLVQPARRPHGPPSRQPSRLARGARARGTLETAASLVPSQALPADSAPLSASSRPADRAPSRTAALTSVRIDSAAIAPSGWMAARLKTSATTKQPSTSAQVISLEVGE